MSDQNIGFSPAPQPMSPQHQPTGGYVGPSPGYGGAPPQPSKGLAVAAMILGILAILGCLIPVVNFFSAFLAVIGLALGIVVLVRRMGGRGMAIAGVALSAVAIIGVIISNVLFGAAVTAVDESLSSATMAPSAADESESPDQPGSGDESEPADSTQPSADASEADAPLAVGTAGTVGDYSVTVTKVNTNANEFVKAANQFNDSPAGQYVVADVSVTYNGDDKGTPWVDLDWAFEGTDARNYDTASMCSLDNSDFDAPDLRKGGTATYALCFDVAADAINGGTMTAEETLSFEDSKASWKVTG